VAIQIKKGRRYSNTPEWRKHHPLLEKVLPEGEGDDSQQEENGKESDRAQTARV